MTGILKNSTVFAMMRESPIFLILNLAFSSEFYEQ
jgi:hypothetical protein